MKNISLVLSLIAVGASLALFAFGYFYVSETAEHKILPAVVYFVSGLVMSSGACVIRGPGK